MLNQFLKSARGSMVAALALAGLILTVELAYTDVPKAEPKSAASKAVNPTVQSEIEKKVSEKRAALLKDAQAALDETRNALEALDKGQKRAAIEALARVTGKLDLIVARDAKLALAPVAVTTIVHDLYSTPEAVKNTVKIAKDHLSSGDVQQARSLLADLGSEAEIQVTDIPLATYPAAIKQIAPLIDAGKTKEAEAAIIAVLNTLVIERYVVPLPKVRGQAMLAEASKLAQKPNRTADENANLKNLIEAARHELQLGEALGYGVGDNYKPLYAQLDEVQKKAEGGQANKGLLDKLEEMWKNFKFTS